MRKLKIRKGLFGMDMQQPYYGSNLGTPTGYGENLSTLDRTGRSSYPSLSKVDPGVSINPSVTRQSESKWIQAINNGTAKSSTSLNEGSTETKGGNIGQGILKGMATVGKGTDLVQQAFGIDVDEDSTYKQEQMVGDMMLTSGNPYVMAAGAIVKTNSLLNQAMGTNMNTLTNHQAREVGMNKAQNALNTGLGFFLNTAAPGLGGFFGKTADAQKSQDVNLIRGAFSGTVDDIDQAQKMGGKRYALGKNKVNKYIGTANYRNRLLTDIAQVNNPLVNTYGTTALDFDKQNFNTFSGRDFQSAGTVEQGESGMKLLSKRELARIYASRKPKEVIDTYGDGGKIGVDNNVIPEGALHATKNNLEKINPELDEVTPKGIPVVVTDKNGDYKQVAEIERDELVLTKEVTLLIEDLWKKGTPEDMIEAGKILAKELMENTVNNGDNKD